MKKYLMVLTVFGLFLIGSIQVQADSPERLTGSVIFSGIQTELIPRMVQSISTLAVDTAYDYSQRPVIGILISDFRDDQGREIVIGRDIAAWLREGLNREKQFFVYGSRHPVHKSLESVIAIDPGFKPVWQKRFQDYLSNQYNNVQVDLIITGKVIKETQEHLRITATLSPLFKKIRLVETEFEKGNSTQVVFLSPSLTSSEMGTALSVLPNGRLVVLAHLNPKFEQTDPARGLDHGKQSYQTKKVGPGTLKSQWEFKSPNALSIWLDDGIKKLSLIRIKDWPDWKKKEYENLFSEFEVDTLWFDDALTEGTHSLFLSVSTAKDNFQTFSKTINVKAGVTQYLVFSIESDLTGKPELFFKSVVDTQRK
jgi:hypothetical protein